MNDQRQLLAAVETLLAGDGPPPWEAILDRALRHFDCPLGTVHVIGADGQLHLAAQRGLPPPVLDKVRVIPIGKGMAGIAAQRREAVQVCNLQNDGSGVVRPGAKLTKMEGSIAAPMLDGDRLAGVFGVAKPVEYEFTAAESAALMALGQLLAKRC